MVVYTIEQRVFIVRTYWITNSFKQCQIEFRKKYGGRDVLSKSVIQKMVRKLETTGSLIPTHGGGRPKLSQETIDDVQHRLQQSPLTPLRSIAQETGRSYSTCQRAAKMAKLHACRVVQGDGSPRLNVSGKKSPPASHAMQSVTHMSRMSTGEHLFQCGEPAIWRGVYEKYWAVVEAKDARKGKNSGKLMELEKWYHEELPVNIAGRTERFLTHPELVKLMEWKLTRGKFRPRLKQLVSSNSEDEVHRCTKKAFSLLPDVKSAIAELSTLKGLGPATASAVLAAGAPDEVPFMADEAVESIADLKPVQYTAKHFSLFLEKILHKKQQLNEVDCKQDWTAHRVELCLWAYTVANQIEPSLMEVLQLSDSDQPSETIKKMNEREETSLPQNKGTGLM